MVLNTVTVHENQSKEALVWAKKYCPNYITNRAFSVTDGYSSKHEYVFYFVPNSPDITAFALRWS